MSPRTRRFPLAAGALLLSAACGAPPGSEPIEPPAPAASAPSPAGVPVGGPVPSSFPMTPINPLPTTQGYPVPGYTLPTPGYATPPPQPGLTTTATTAPLTKSPTPTPTHAAKCPAEPTGAQILVLIKNDPGVPDKKLAIAEGPFCSGVWTFTTVKIDGQPADQVEPLMVVSTGKGSKLALVAAGTHVCNAKVQAEAPAGIRVLACGF